MRCLPVSSVRLYTSVVTCRCMFSPKLCVLLLQLEPLVNGPFTPDLANPISQLGKNAQEKGWPMDIKVGQLHVLYCQHISFITTNVTTFFVYMYARLFLHK